MPGSNAKRTPSSTSERALEIKQKEDAELRPYVVVSEIGSGSFATVYKGYHEVRVLFYSCRIF